MTSLLAFALVLGQSAAAHEIPFRIGDNAIIADAKVNGRDVSCMFDTGFSGAFVLNDAMNVGTPSGTMTLRDFVGEFQAKTVPIKTLQLGGLAIKTPELTVVQQPMAHMSESYNTHTDGIMGLEVMKDYILEINFERQKFVLHPKTSDPIAAKKPDNVKSWVIRMLPIGHNSVELPVTAPSGEHMVLALDTGNAFYATTHRDVLERVGLWKKGEKPKFMRSSWVASGPVDSWDFYINEVNIWGVPVKGSTWSIIDLPSSSSDHDGTVGFGFLKNFNIIIDSGRRRVYLQQFTKAIAEPPKATIGLSAFYFEPQKRNIVVNITPQGPAEKAGLKRGDHLLSIDGVELINQGGRKIFELMEGDPGTMVKLVVSRGGNLMRFEVPRMMLINGDVPAAAASPGQASAR